MGFGWGDSESRYWGVASKMGGVFGEGDYVLKAWCINPITKEIQIKQDAELSEW